MNNTTSGKTMDCLADFFKRFGRTEALWKFVKVDSQTERRWRGNRTEPYGESYIRVMYFLNLVGYQVEELNNISHELFELGQCLVCDLVTITSASEQLGTDVQSLYRYFRKGIGPSTERISAFAAIVQPKRDELYKAILQKRNELKQFSISNAGSPAVIETPVENSSSTAVIAGLEKNLDGILEYGGQLLNGPKEARYAMRRKLCEGLKPKLQAAWQVLNNLLREQSN